MGEPRIRARADRFRAALKFLRGRAGSMARQMTGAPRNEPSHWPCSCDHARRGGAAMRFLVIAMLIVVPFLSMGCGERNLDEVKLSEQAAVQAGDIAKRPAEFY